MENYPYQKEWEEYKNKGKLGCIGLVILLGSVVYFRQYDAFNNYVPLILFPILFTVVIVSFFKDLNWKCPRCKKAFNPKKGIAAWLQKNCVNCDLPLYFGSNYFLEYWETERAKELVEKNKEQGGKI
jgi:hypothetical protein